MGWVSDFLKGRETLEEFSDMHVTPIEFGALKKGDRIVFCYEDRWYSGFVGKKEDGAIKVTPFTIPVARALGYIVGQVHPLDLIHQEYSGLHRVIPERELVRVYQEAPW